MRKTKPTPTAEQLAEADRLEAEVRRKRERAEESFQRCDTDGFVSQWALGIGADRDRMDAQILRDGGMASFPVLCDADGNVIADRIYSFENRYNGGTDYRWRLPDELAEIHGRKWIPTGERSRVQAQLGLHEETRWMPARAKIMGGGTGLSGAASAYVGIERITESEVAA